MVHVCVLQKSTLLFILNASLAVTDETMVGLIPNMLFFIRLRSDSCQRGQINVTDLKSKLLCVITACINIRTREKKNI